MEEKDRLIASLRQQLRQALSKSSALEQENALLSHELERLKSLDERVKRRGVV